MNVGKRYYGSTMTKWPSYIKKQPVVSSDYQAHRSGEMRLYIYIHICWFQQSILKNSHDSLADKLVKQSSILTIHSAEPPPPRNMHHSLSGLSLYFAYVSQHLLHLDELLVSLPISPGVSTLSEKAMAPHSSTLACKIPWTEAPGRLQSMGSRRVGHDWSTSLSLFTFMHWRRKWQPTPVFLPGESQRRGSLVGCRLQGHTELDTTEASEQQQQHSIDVYPGVSNGLMIS